MSFRYRLFIAFLLAGLVPIVVLAFVVRNEMTERLTRMYESQITDQVEAIVDVFGVQSEEIAIALSRLKNVILDDNRLRTLLIDRNTQDRRYLLDFAMEQLPFTGLDMLQLQGESSRILSSGHFRNEYDRIEKNLPQMLAGSEESAGEAMLIEARSPDGTFYALVRVDSFQVASQPFYLIGGAKIDTAFVAGLTQSAALSVTASFLDPSPSTAQMVREVSLPYIDLSREQVTEAQFYVHHNQAELALLRASVDRWFWIAGGIASVLAVLVLTWISIRMSRPLKELAEKTAMVDLDRLDINFQSNRKDEIGALSRLLGSMTDRLRKSAVLIKDAERRAAVGELARQVNHDIKNGLTPLRNVIRHLGQLSASNPQEMAGVFEERKETLESSLDYLQTLAANYARLTPQIVRTNCDLNAIVRVLVKDARALSKGRLQVRLAPGAEVRADSLALRRILENLLDNALDSLEDANGVVIVSTEQVAIQDEAKIRLVVEDTGVGMTQAQTAKIFQDFYTTKEKGTGLGLSIVRRLVMDLDGSIRVESTPGEGTRFVLDLPAGK